MTMKRETATRLAILVLVAIATRGWIVGNPLVHVDEEFYLAVAHAMWRGAVPFVDIWDRKPIGLFLLYMPAAALPLRAAVFAYQLAALAAAVATALVICRLGARAGWGRGATLAGVAYLLWLIPLGGMAGQAPVFYNLPMAGAAWLIVAGEAHGNRRAAGLAAMALVGVALQIKYSVVFEGFFFGLWLLRQEWRTSRSAGAFIGYGAVLVAVALLPTLTVAAIYALRGQGDAFVFANFVSVMHRNPDPIGEIARNIGILVLILSPILSMAMLGAKAPDQPTMAGSEDRRFLLCWTMVAGIALATFSPWFDHYGLPLLVPATACAAGFFAGERRRIGLVVLSIVAVAGQVALIVNTTNRGSAAQFWSMARTIGAGPGCLWIYAGPTLLHEATGRCFVSRYLVPAHLNRMRERGAVGVDRWQEVERILAARPAVVVMRPPFRGEDRTIRSLVTARMANGYRLTEIMPIGAEQVAIYRREPVSGR